MHQFDAPRARYQGRVFGAFCGLVVAFSVIFTLNAAQRPALVRPPIFRPAPDRRRAAVEMDLSLSRHNTFRRRCLEHSVILLFYQTASFIAGRPCLPPEWMAKLSRIPTSDNVHCDDSLSPSNPTPICVSPILHAYRGGETTIPCGHRGQQKDPTSRPAHSRPVATRPNKIR
jgi:hypothetical protein